MQPMTIPIKNANYHDETFHDPTIASATSIRKQLFNENQSSTLEPFIPKN